jgi:hypothetical protein
LRSRMDSGCYCHVRTAADWWSFKWSAASRSS